MKARMYQCKTGKYKGMWHVRIFNKYKYSHVGRYKSKSIANKIVSDLNEELTL